MKATRSDDGRIRRGRNSRAKLLAAAGRVFAARGYRAATVDEITSLAGVAHGTFYRHFQGKDDMLVHLLTDLTAAFEQTLDDPYEITSVAANRQITEERIRRFLQLAAQWQQTLSVYNEARSVSPLVAAHWQAVTARIVERAVADIERWTQAGRTRGLDPVVAAQHLVHGVEHFFWQVALGKEPVAAIERIAATVADLHFWGTYLGDGDAAARIAKK